MQPKYVDTSLVSQDAFDGKSHERIAKALSNHIKSEGSKHGIIGLEGEWGVGKSSITTMMKEELKSHHVFVFDAWGHQGDPPRRAFLAELTEELIDKGLLGEKDKSRNYWEKKLRDLLAFKSFTNKKEIPKLDEGLGIVLSYIGVSAIAAMLWKLERPKELAEFGAIFVICSIIVLTILFSLYLLNRNAQGKEEIMPSLFYSFKGRILNSITKESVFKQEPLVRDFKEWMSDLSGSINQPLVVVYDNLDRLPYDLIKEQWAAIHTFFAESLKNNQQISVVVPYSKTHIKNALLDKDDQESLDHIIQKTIGIIYRVSPPILTDWRRFFRDCLEYSFEDTLEVETLGTLTMLVDYYLEDKTPRTIQFFTNELVTLYRLWKDEIPFHHLAVSVLLKGHFSDDIEQNFIDGNYKSVAQRLNLEVFDLVDSLAAISFNVQVSKAKQIVFGKALVNNLMPNKSSNVTIGEISKHKDFIELLKATVEGGLYGIDKAIATLYPLEPENINDPENYLDKLWQKFGKEFMSLKETVNYEESISTVEALLVKLTTELKDTFFDFVIDDLKSGHVSGIEYYQLSKRLNNFIISEELDIKIDRFSEEYEMSSGDYISCLEYAGKDCYQYGVKTNYEVLDDYILVLLKTGEYFDKFKPDSFVDIPTSFGKSIIYIEDQITTRKFKYSEFKMFLDTYKVLSKGGMLRLFDMLSLDLLMDRYDINSKEAADLIAQSIIYGKAYVEHCMADQIDNYGYRLLLLSGGKYYEDERLPIKVANVFSFYGTIDDLMESYNNCKSKFIRQVKDEHVKLLDN